jgi:Mono-functional DNA-alkylating methyl methanesulfonate N-term
MIAAVEKQKLVYILNRDSAARLTISSPLEAHKAHTIVFSMCGVDVGFENPIFACLEVDYEEVCCSSSTIFSPSLTLLLSFSLHPSLYFTFAFLTPFFLSFFLFLGCANGRTH